MTIRPIVVLVTLLLTTNPATARDEPTLRVLMTVGGVGYHTQIVRQLRQNENIDLVVRDYDTDPIVFTRGSLNNIDAVLMYHRDNIAEPQEREALLAFLNAGGGVVVLHHAIANFPDWETWWRGHVGGLYVLHGHDGQRPSRYYPAFEGVAVAAQSHPVIKRVTRPWRYADESYEHLWISDSVTTLLRTTAHGADERLAWIGPSKSGRVVYVQPGHDDRIMRDPIYIGLLEDALVWTAGIDGK